MFRIFPFQRDHEIRQGLEVEFIVLFRDRCDRCAAIGDFDAVLPNDDFDTEALLTARLSTRRTGQVEFDDRESRKHCCYQQEWYEHHHEIQKGGYVDFVGRPFGPPLVVMPPCHVG